MSTITQVSLEDQLRKNPGLDKQALDELDAWIKSQFLLPRLSGADLAVFYLSNNYDLEATKRNISNYFIMRHYMPEFFAKHTDLQSPELRQVFETVFIVTLKKRTKENHKVILARLMNVDPTKYNFSNAAKVMNMLIDTEIYEDGPDNQYVFVFDLNGAVMEHSHTLSSMGLKKFHEYLRKGNPGKWIGSHYTNTGFGNADFQKFVEKNIVYDNPMVHFHPDMDTLLDATGMERSMLPKEMGGDAGTVLELQRQQTKKLESYHAFFVALENKTKLPNTEIIPSALEIFGPNEYFF